MNRLTPTFHPRVRKSSTSQHCNRDMSLSYAVLTLTWYAAWLGYGMIMYVYVHGYVNMSVGLSCHRPTLVSFSPPHSLKHAYAPLSILLVLLHVCVRCCGLLGTATLPRLLMPYLLLIRMSRLSPAICTSWLANPLPTVWCRRGTQRLAHDGVAAPDLKRPFCFVVLFSFFLSFFWGGKAREKSWCFHLGWQVYRRPRWVWIASGKGTSPSVCRVSAALDVLDLSWQMLKQKVEEGM